MKERSKSMASVKHRRADATGEDNRIAGIVAAIGGATGALVSAFVTTLLLLVNGSLTLVLLGELSDQGLDWIQRKGMAQLALLIIPLLMLVVEWMMMDVVRSTFSRDSSEEDRWNSI